MGEAGGEEAFEGVSGAVSELLGLFLQVPLWSRAASPACSSPRGPAHILAYTRDLQGSGKVWGGVGLVVYQGAL